MIQSSRAETRRGHCQARIKVAAEVELRFAHEEDAPLRSGRQLAARARGRRPISSTRFDPLLTLPVAGNARRPSESCRRRNATEAPRATAPETSCERDCSNPKQTYKLSPRPLATPVPPSRLGIFQVQRVETFGEQVVDRHEEVVSRCTPDPARARRRPARGRVGPIERGGPDPSSGALLRRYDVAI